jgi:hypothetical protein
MDKQLSRERRAERARNGFLYRAGGVGAIQPRAVATYSLDLMAAAGASDDSSGLRAESPGAFGGW